jgi:hypothetical protein
MLFRGRSQGTSSPPTAFTHPSKPPSTHQFSTHNSARNSVGPPTHPRVLLQSVFVQHGQQLLPVDGPSDLAPRALDQPLLRGRRQGRAGRSGAGQVRKATATSVGVHYIAGGRLDKTWPGGGAWAAQAQGAAGLPGATVTAHLVVGVSHPLQLAPACSAAALPVAIAVESSAAGAVVVAASC